MCFIKNKITPGVSRDNRISDDGLCRLEKQLKNGARMAKPVLRQWVKRYGDAAKTMIIHHGYDLEE